MAEESQEQPKEEAKAEPVKLVKTAAQLKQEEMQQLGVQFFNDMESMLSSAERAAKKEENTIKAKADDLKKKSRDQVWKYVQSLTDKNLALIYEAYDSVKMVGNIPYEYTKYAIIQRFIERALQEGKPVTAPFQIQI